MTFCHCWKLAWVYALIELWHLYNGPWQLMCQHRHDDTHSVLIIFYIWIKGWFCLDTWCGVAHGQCPLMVRPGNHDTNAG